MVFHSAAPRRIDPVFVERVWGRTDLAPLFGQFDKAIGEVWFPIEPDFPLLVKFLFTDQKLSVQVHPGDDYALRNENSRGKTEMWHILAAEPDARIALGFTRQMEPGELRAVIADGSVEQHLRWVPVAAGDTLFAPAGVVHAIGAGVVLCEIQQNSDVTYRLYDYGRPRELHLERGLEVCDMGVHEGRREFPVICSQFVTERIGCAEAEAPPDCDHLLIVLSGDGTIGGQQFGRGEVWMMPGGESAHVESTSAAQFLRTRCGDTSDGDV
jgi:mannose-6-phosphate isomerase